jgi:hypothetical protein
MAFGEGLQQRFWDAMASRKAQRVAGALVVALSVIFVVLFLYAATKRMQYPFEVEWIENGILLSVLRIVHGQGLYVAPTLHFVPFLYTPLYLYVAAAVAKVTGVAGHSYMAMRLVSTLATLGSCVVIYALVMTETRRWVAGVAAAGVFVACYSVVDGFFDIGRVDALFVFLLLLALLAQRRGYPVLAALVWVLVFQTKQTVLPLAVLILCAEWQRPRRMFAALATFVVMVTVSVMVLNHATGGWYDFYIFGVARGLPIVARQVMLFVPVSVVEPMAAAWVVIVAAAVMTRVKYRESSMFYLFVAFALYGGVWFVASHRGASVNSIMPVYALTAVLFGIAMSRLLDYAEASVSPRLAVAVLLAGAVQLVALIYNPGRFIPPASAAEKTQRFIEQVRALPGDVYMVNHNYDAVLAGKEPHAEGEALGAVMDAKRGQISADLRAELDAAMAEHRFTAVVDDDTDPRETAWHFERQYPVEVSTGLSNFRYITSQPQWFLLPCDVKAEVRAQLMRKDAVVADGVCGK